MIRFTETSDGVRIAYAVSGHGVPLVRTPAPFNHIEREWDIPAIRDWSEKLSARWQLIRYDPRGQGLSQREDVEYSRAGYLRDLEAVMAAVTERPVVLYGQTAFTIATVDYTKAHPGDVRAVVAWNPHTAESARLVFSTMRAAEDDFAFFSRAAAQGVLGWAGAEIVRQFTDLMQASTDPRDIPAQLDVWGEVLRAEPLGAVYAVPEVPTLVLYYRDGPAARHARAVVAAIPHAHQRGLEGDSEPPWARDSTPVVAAIASFLEEVGAPDQFLEEVGAVDQEAVAAASRSAGLTNREVQVVRLLAQGMSNRAIAGELVIAPATVARHVSNILNKTSLANRTALTRFASESGLL